jgi:hypothetical protein
MLLRDSLLYQVTAYLKKHQPQSVVAASNLAASAATQVHASLSWSIASFGTESSRLSGRFIWL